MEVNKSLKDIIDKKSISLRREGNYARYQLLDVPFDTDCTIDDFDFVKELNDDMSVVITKLGLDKIVNYNGYIFLVRKYIPEERKLQAESNEKNNPHGRS